jgi:hypothetical protein
MMGGDGSDPPVDLAKYKLSPEELAIDIEQYRLTQEDLAAHKAPTREQAATGKKASKQPFTKFLDSWEGRLATASSASASTYRVALHVLRLHWKNNGEPFPLPNGALKAKGVSRYAKGRALDELERLGLISVRKRSNRSPRITVHNHPRDTDPGVAAKF